METTVKKKFKIFNFKKNNSPIVCITCYDALFAKIIEFSNAIDVVLVGDSLGHIIQGKDNTISVTLDQMIYHTQCVASQLKTPFLISDLPLLARSPDLKVTYDNALALMISGAQAVKIEGATSAICEQIHYLVEHGIPVVGHIGLTPQHIQCFGSYFIQGKNEDHAIILLEQAKNLEKAGCTAIVMELIEHGTAQKVTSSIKIPTIGIGAGVGCDGQILVLHDMLGLNMEFKPKFLKEFAHIKEVVTGALQDYSLEVKNKIFPLQYE